MKKLTLVLPWCLPVLFFALADCCFGFVIHQLTENEIRDSRPSVYNGTIAWEAVDAENDTEIFYWDGTVDSAGRPQIRQITDNGVDDRLPSLYDGAIAWERSDGIYYWDGASVEKVVGSNSTSIWPSLYDGTIAWEQWDDRDIYFWDGENAKNVTKDNPFSVNEYMPSLHGGGLAWQGEALDPYTGWALNAEIYYWNGNDVVPVTANNTSDIAPCLFAGTIAWKATSGDGGIYFWDGSFGPDGNPVHIEKVTDHVPWGKIAVFDGSIAWSAWDGSDYEIYYWNGTDTKQVTDNDSDDFCPSIHGGLLAWQGFDGSDAEIYYTKEVGTDSRPIADAGQDRTAIAESVVSLDGSASYDLNGTYPLHYQWEMTSKPENSAASLSGVSEVYPSFSADVPGLFLVQLVVTNADGSPSAPDVVRIVAQDPPLPVLDYIEPPRCTAGETVTLVGQAFGDVQGASEVHVGNRVFNGTSARIKSWSDTQITVRIPSYGCNWFKSEDTRKVRLWVTVNDTDSNKRRLKVVKPVDCP